MHGPALGAGYRAPELSSYCELVLQQADAIEAALDAGIWTESDALSAGCAAELVGRDRMQVEVASCGCSWGSCCCVVEREPMSCPSHWFKSSDRHSPPEMFLPFPHTVQVARNCYQTLPGGGHNLCLIYKTLTNWAEGYIKSVRKWLPRLLLLPFRIGDLEDPLNGPALARALIRVCWQGKLVPPSKALDVAWVQAPSMYQEYGPFNEQDSKCI